MSFLPRCFAVLLMFLYALLGAKAHPAQLLEANLNTWEQFRWQGVVQVKHEALTARKFFTLAKNTEALRLDIIDSGVMGLNSMPILSLYIKDKIALEAPTIKQLQGLDPNWYITPDKYKPFFAMSSEFRTNSAEIIANHKLSLKGQTYFFDKKYRLTLIKIPLLKMEAKIEYKKKYQPDKVSLNYEGKEVAIFYIDDISIGNIAIIPLETPDTVNSDLSGTEQETGQKLYNDPE